MLPSLASLQADNLLCSTRWPWHILNAAASSSHLACFGALHEPRRRHAHPCPARANGCRSSGPPPISQAICHKARNTPPLLESHSLEAPFRLAQRASAAPSPWWSVWSAAVHHSLCTLAARHGKAPAYTVLYSSCVQRNPNTTLTE